MIISLILVTSLSFQAPARPKFCDPEDATACVQYVIKGDRVPFTGQLLSIAKAAKLAANQAQMKDLLKLEIDRVHKQYKVRLDALNELRYSEAQQYRDKLNLMDARLQRAYEKLNTPWYKNPVYIMGIAGIVASAALTTAVLVAN